MSKSTQHASDSATPARRGSALHGFKTVAWGFFGVRKRAGHEADIANLSLAQIIITGLVCPAIFVGTLLTVVSIVL